MCEESFIINTMALILIEEKYTLLISANDILSSEISIQCNEVDADCSPLKDPGPLNPFSEFSV